MDIEDQDQPQLPHLRDALSSDHASALAIVRSRARAAIRHAVQTGEIQVPATCASCGHTGRRLLAHHRNYAAPLDVEWYCTKCHALFHSLRRKIIARALGDGRLEACRPGGKAHATHEAWMRKQREAGLPAGGHGKGKRRRRSGQGKGIGAAIPARAKSA